MMEGKVMPLVDVSTTAPSEDAPPSVPPRLIELALTVRSHAAPQGADTPVSTVLSNVTAPLGASSVTFD